MWLCLTNGGRKNKAVSVCSVQPSLSLGPSSAAVVTGQSTQNLLKVSKSLCSCLKISQCWITEHPRDFVCWDEVGIEAKEKYHDGLESLTRTCVEHQPIEKPPFKESEPSAQECIGQTELRAQVLQPHLGGNTVQEACILCKALLQSHGRWSRAAAQPLQRHRESHGSQHDQSRSCARKHTFGFYFFSACIALALALSHLTLFPIPEKDGRCRVSRCTEFRCRHSVDFF